MFHILVEAVASSVSILPKLFEPSNHFIELFETTSTKFLFQRLVTVVVMFYEAFLMILICHCQLDENAKMISNRSLLCIEE